MTPERRAELRALLAKASPAASIQSDPMAIGGRNDG